MAWVFEIIVGFGKNHVNSVEFRGEMSSVTLKSGRISLLESAEGDVWCDGEKNWWCRIVPSGASMTGRGDNTILDPVELLELANEIYERLKSFKCFRVAMVGWEKSELACESQIVRLLCMGESTGFGGLVICDEIWRLTSSPHHFEPFSPGLFWQPIAVKDVKV